MWEGGIANCDIRNVTRYAYFGAFRSDVSNVGPNAAMLTQDGKLTDIGSWYLGGEATNNIPKLSGAAGTPASHRNLVIFSLWLAGNLGSWIYMF